MNPAGPSSYLHLFCLTSSSLICVFKKITSTVQNQHLLHSFSFLVCVNSPLIPPPPPLLPPSPLLSIFLLKTQDGDYEACFLSENEGKESRKEGHKEDSGLLGGYSSPESKKEGGERIN